MLNPSIILAGQSPDIVNALANSNVAAQQRVEFDRTNAMNRMLQEQGAGIIAGDQNALNALAGYSPEAAMGIQESRLGMDATRLGMDQTRQQMAVLDDATKRAAEEYARGLSKEQAAAEAAQLEAGVKQALMAPNAAAFDALMTQMGRPELVGQFENRQMLAGQFMSVAEILKMTAPPDQGERYKVVGGSLFDLQAPGGPAAVGQGAMQEEVIMGPDGKAIVVKGGPGTTAKFTEGQSKDNVYATRAEGALERLEPVADALTSRAGMVGEAASGISLGLSREVMQSDEYQLARQAGDEFLQAILRKDTGAAITADEQMLYGKTYLPQVGDSPAVLAQKRVSRAGALEAIRAGMNQAQIEAVARADAATIARLSQQGGSAPAAPEAPAAPKRATEMSDDEFLESLGLK